MVMLTTGLGLGTCKNCKCVILGDTDDSQGFCTDSCWEEWKAAVTEREKKEPDTRD